MQRRLMYATLLLGCWLLSPSVGSAEKMYQITEPELIRLEQRLQQQKMVISSSKAELVLLTRELKTSQNQLAELRHQLVESQKILIEQSSSIENANKYLQEYETEVRHNERRLKNQRIIWQVLAGFLFVKALS